LGFFYYNKKKFKMVDVTGIDRDKLLLALWTNSKPAAFFKNIPHMIPSFDLNQAKLETRNGYVD